MQSDIADGMQGMFYVHFYIQFDFNVFTYPWKMIKVTNTKISTTALHQNARLSNVCIYSHINKSYVIGFIHIQIPILPFVCPCFFWKVGN